MSENSEQNMAPEKESPPEPATPSTSATEDVCPGSTTPMIDTKSHKKAEGDKTSDKPGVQIRDPPVSETRGYQIVEVKEKHGQLYLAIPSMPLGLSVICCLLNIVLPGTGEYDT